MKLKKLSVLVLITFAMVLVAGNGLCLGQASDSTEDMTFEIRNGIQDRKSVV